MRLEGQISLGALLAGALLVIWFHDDNPYRVWPVHLAGGDVVNVGTTSAEQQLDDALAQAAVPDRQHFVVQFERRATNREQARIESATGLRFLDYIPEAAYIVSVPTRFGKSILRDLESTNPALRQAFSLKRDDKHDPLVNIVATGSGVNVTLPDYALDTLYVIFYQDVPVAEQQAVIAGIAGLTVDALWSNGQDGVWKVAGQNDDVTALIDNEATVSDVVAMGFERDLVKMVEQLIYRSEFKRFQSAPGTRLTMRSFWLDRRYPIVNHWRDPG